MTKKKKPSKELASIRRMEKRCVRDKLDDVIQFVGNLANETKGDERDKWAMLENELFSIRMDATYKLGR